MTRRILMTAVLMSAVFGLTLMAEGPLSASWEAGITLDPNGTFVSGLESIIDLAYTTGSVLWTSYSEFQLTVGYLWQEFGVAGRLGAFIVQGDLLFGSSTTDFLYAQTIVTTTLAGVDLSFYYACLSDAVLGGAADGFALRLTGGVGVFDIVLITELGARIEDEDFDGIDIVHAATGFYRHYTIDPVVPGQGFTGEKLCVGGCGYGCIDNIRATLYFTCAGFDFFALDLRDIDLGIGWLKTDLLLRYELQTKSIALTPHFAVGDGFVCFEPYLAIDFGASTWKIHGLTVGGLAFAWTWSGVTVKDLTVFAPGRFVITTEDYGSVIETLEDAIEDGHEYYAEYWELLSIEITMDGCCGGANRMLINSYFDEDASGIFGWGMSYVEACVALSGEIELSGSMTVTAEGVDALGLTVKLRW